MVNISRKVHSYLVLVLLFAMTSQGFFSDFRFYSLPLWLCILCIFVLFVPSYLKFIFELPKQIKLVYFCLLIPAVVVTINVLTSQEIIEDLREILLPYLGLFISLVFLYNYRNNLKKFAFHIASTLFLLAFFSFFQFFYDFNLFEFFLRKEEFQVTNEFGQIKEYSIVRDEGSSGLFGFPVPYGYYLAFFMPIVYSFCIYFNERNSKFYLRFSVFLFLCINFLALLMTFQRGAIIAVIFSLSIIHIIKYGLIKGALFISFLILTSNFLFSSMQNYKDIDFHHQEYKELYSVHAVLGRLKGVAAWIEVIEINKSSGEGLEAVELFKRARIIERNENLWGTNKGSITAKIFQGVESRNENSYLVSGSPHSYLVNIWHRHGLIALLSVILAYSVILFLLLFSYIRDKSQKKYLYAATIMSLCSYNMVALIHNNGHYLRDSIGWIGIGFLIVFLLNDYKGNLFFKDKL